VFVALWSRGEAVAVCTIEKANVAINRLVQQGRLQELCCVIVDVCPPPLQCMPGLRPGLHPIICIPMSILEGWQKKTNCLCAGDAIEQHKAGLRFHAESNCAAFPNAIVG